MIEDNCKFKGEESSSEMMRWRCENYNNSNKLFLQHFFFLIVIRKWDKTIDGKILHTIDL